MLSQSEEEKIEFYRKIIGAPRTIWEIAWYFFSFFVISVSLATVLYHLCGGYGLQEGFWLGLSSFIFSLWFVNYLFKLGDYKKRESLLHIAKLMKQFDEEQTEKKVEKSA